jgi:hypothetical protein
MLLDSSESSVIGTNNVLSAEIHYINQLHRTFSVGRRPISLQDNLYFQNSIYFI